MVKVSILPFQDAYISEWYASKNFGGEIALFVSQYLKPGDDYRSLLQFNLDKIPPGSTIEEATLELIAYRNEVSGSPINVTAHRLLSSWNQYSVTWNNQPQAKSTPDGVVTIFSGPPHEPEKVCIDITKLVRGWYDGSIPNHGLLLKGNERKNDLVGFRSTNFEDRDAWPVLHIKYADKKLKIYEKETLVIPSRGAPLEASTPVPLGARTKATFLVKNDSDCEHVQVMLQVGYSDNPLDTFFDAGPWFNLKPCGYPGEAVALSTDDAAEYARVLVRGKGGETVLVWARSYEL